MNKPTVEELLETIKNASSNLNSLQDEVEIRKLNRAYVSNELQKVIDSLEKYNDYFKIDCV